jgi:hypothetical protein
MPSFLERDSPGYCCGEKIVKSMALLLTSLSSRGILSLAIHHDGDSKKIRAGIILVCIATCVLSCALPGNASDATLRLSFTLPTAQSRGLEPASPKLLHPDTALIRIEVSAPDMAPRTSDIELIAGSDQASAVITVPISTIERTITVTALLAGGVPFSRGTVTQVLKRGENSIQIGLLPQSPGATISGTSDPFQQTIPSGDVVVNPLIFPESGDYCVSLDYTTSDFWVCDADGKLARRIGGSPEKWYIVHAEANKPVYSMIRSRGQTDNLIRQKAVYVVPGTVGSGAGTRENPFSGFSQGVYNAVAGSASAPVRVLLARGVYTDIVLDLTAGKSIYGGFEPSGWTRDIKANDMTQLQGTVSVDGFIRSTSNLIDGETVIDGVWARGLEPVAPEWVGSTTGLAVPAGNSYCMNMAYSPSIRNCVITGPEITTVYAPSSLIALYIRPSISNVPVAIIGNHISAGLLRNSITAGFAVYGIRDEHAGTYCLIAENDIDAGYRIGSSTGDAMSTFGIEYSQSPWIVNNTIDIGTMYGVSSEVMEGINNASTNSFPSHICSNIVFSAPPPTMTEFYYYLLYGYTANNRATHLLYNGFFAYTAPRMNYVQFVNNSGVPYLVPETPGASLNDPSAVLDGGTALGNETGGFDASMFQGYIVPDSIASIFSKDLRLSASAPAATFRGGITAAELNSTYGLPAVFVPYLLYDKNGNLRPASGWSTGAHQY